MLDDLQDLLTDAYCSQNNETYVLVPTSTCAQLNFSQTTSVSLFTFLTTYAGLPPNFLNNIGGNSSAGAVVNANMLQVKKE